MVSPMERYAPRRPVDNRLPLRIYFRAAENILKQANVYRREQNVIELYVLLLRYASLVSETMPQHQQYWGMHQIDKAHLRRKLVDVVQELERLKPEAQLHWKARNLQIPRSPRKNQEQLRKGPLNNAPPQRNLQEQFQNLSLNIPPPKAETLARHSLISFAPKNTRISDLPLRVQYPTLEDGSNRFQRINPIENRPVMQPYPKNPFDVVFEPEAVPKVDVEAEIEVEAEISRPSQFDLVNQLAPPPLPAPVEVLEVIKPDVELAHHVNSKEPKKMHMSMKVMDEFMEMAKANTVKNIETCGVLAGIFENGTFFVTTLIVPKQTATMNTCETQNEEEIFEAQESRGLFQLGWIHTHPTQSCFMSSVDLHTHYSYQVMLQEAIAIVMSPQDSSRNYGIFRLSDPGGISLIQQCPKRGFHAHDRTSDGSPIYENSSHVLWDAKSKLDVVDLR